MAKSTAPLVTFTPYKAKDGWRWRATSKGRIVAESGEGYKRQRTMIRSLARFLTRIRSRRDVIERHA